MDETQQKFSGKTVRVDIPALNKLFGANVPIEAIVLIFEGPHSMTLGEVRASIGDMANAWDQPKFHLDRLKVAQSSLITSISIATGRLAEADRDGRVYLIQELSDAADCLEATDQDLQHLRGEGC